jgi:hypothetical protein
MTGFDINWNAPTSSKVVHHPLYQKYNMTNFDTITLTEVKADLGTVLATQGSAAICSYLAWLIRIKNLLS